MSFNYKRTTREFNYKPVYWDKEKDEREARRRATLSRAELDNNETQEYIPGSYIRGSSVKRMRSANRENSKSKVGLYRTAIFIVLVFAVMYIMTDFLELL